MGPISSRTGAWTGPQARISVISGATIHTCPSKTDEKAADAALEAIARTVRARGGRPYVIHLGEDHPPLDALGYIDAAREVLEQARDTDLWCGPGVGRPNHPSAITEEAQHYKPAIKNILKQAYSEWASGC